MSEMGIQYKAWIGITNFPKHSTWGPNTLITYFPKYYIIERELAETKRLT